MELRPFVDLQQQLEQREMDLEMEEQLTALSGGVTKVDNDFENEALKVELRLLEHRKRELEAQHRETTSDCSDYDPSNSLKDEIKLIRDLYGMSLDRDVEDKKLVEEEHYMSVRKPLTSFSHSDPSQRRSH